MLVRSHHCARAPPQSRGLMWYAGPTTTQWSCREIQKSCTSNWKNQFGLCRLRSGLRSPLLCLKTVRLTGRIGTAQDRRGICCKAEEIGAETSASAGWKWYQGAGCVGRAVEKVIVVYWGYCHVAPNFCTAAWERGGVKAQVLCFDKSRVSSTRRGDAMVWSLRIRLMCNASGFPESIPYKRTWLILQKNWRMPRRSLQSSIRKVERPTLLRLTLPQRPLRVRIVSA